MEQQKELNWPVVLGPEMKGAWLDVKRGAGGQATVEPQTPLMGGPMLGLEGEKSACLQQVGGQKYCPVGGPDSDCCNRRDIPYKWYQPHMQTPFGVFLLHEKLTPMGHQYRWPEVDYLQAPKIYVKWTRYWVRHDTRLPSQSSPSMLVRLSYPEHERRDWTFWPKCQACYELTDLETAAKTALHASRKEPNLCRSDRLLEWAAEAYDFSYLLRIASLSPFSTMFKCPPPCNKAHDSKQGLSRHQRICDIYNGSEDEDDDEGTSLSEKFEQIRASKRVQLNPPDEPPVPEEPVPMVVDDPVVPPAPPQASPAPAPSPEPEVTPAGRPIRTKCLTWKLLQQLPEPPTPAPELVVADPDRDATPPPAPTAFIFGLYREYPRLPTYDPDSTISLNDLSDIPKPPAASLPSESRRVSPANVVPSALAPSATGENIPYYPFPNSTAYGITDWMWSGSPLKSIQEVTKLVTFLKSDAFARKILLASISCRRLPC
ncbi:hypothetical protein C8R44DRAFT_730346 [Mycena epipterygia]|nr:hypothetical protein C8R44DRAFT_730346 [Mycena epipterygia]